MYVKTKIAGLLVALTLVSPTLAATSFWDATADFSSSASSGVNGVWSYGYTSTLYGSFTAYPNFHLSSSLAAWSKSGTNYPEVPGFGKAIGTTFTCCSTVKVDANTLWSHPGSDGTYSVLRFLAPSAGQYSIKAGFWSDDNRQSTSNLGSNGASDIHMHLSSNATDIASGVVAGPYTNTTPMVNFSNVVTLAASEAIYISMGYGKEQSHSNDSIGLQATVTAVPEPSEWALMLAGLSAVGLIARRRSVS
jgi:hypothetical protein